MSLIEVGTVEICIIVESTAFQLEHEDVWGLQLPKDREAARKYIDYPKAAKIQY